MVIMLSCRFLLLSLLLLTPLTLPAAYAPGGDRTAYEVLAEPVDVADGSGIIEELVDFYQRRISTHDGARCIFYPTCSAYFREAMTRYGLLRATLMFVDRILFRENRSASRFYPVHGQTGGLSDPVPRGGALNPGGDGR
jgi:putative component of membrane protein insertase Oxa1/YidC/SpoIIIJ protein YidD